MKSYQLIFLLLFFQSSSTLVKAQGCDSSMINFCRSIVTDTVMNPYATGMLGNWRNHKAYTYFGARAYSDTATQTNIRINGKFEDFVPFWDFAEGVITPQTDTNRWVWNSEITQFNQKGFEIENRDPLGRFNAGLYGYNQTLPIAVIQNSKVRESGFDGFEDYLFVNGVCDTACSSTKHFGFSSYASQLDMDVKHSGRYSLRLPGNGTAAISYPVTTLAKDTAATHFTVNTTYVSCLSDSSIQDVRVDSTILLPGFSPLQGDKMVFSAWVKEAQNCACSSYAKNRVRVIIDGGTSITAFTPMGNIIEGWQRYEGTFTLPGNAHTLAISLESTDASTPVNFDDVRIFPFNANMKSFVYHPINLRLMAELDENNFATFYEYDDDGTLARVKKETERGVQTIKETRSALIKP